MTMKFASLHSADASIVLECRKGAPPLWRHLGARIEFGGLEPLGRARTSASFSLDEDIPLSTVPPAGLGWFGPPCMVLRRGGCALIPVFTEVHVEQGKDVITIHLVDPAAGVSLEQRIGLDGGGALLFDAELTNTGSAPVAVDWMASAVLPLPACSAQLFSWRGRHNAELVEVAEPMPQHSWLREGRRGIGGHGGPPAVIVEAAGVTPHAGLVYSLQLAWSGDARLMVERDDEGFWTLSAGAVLQAGEVLLQPGECFAAPQVILAVSVQGRNGAMAQHHAAVRARMSWPGEEMRPRPVHCNSWEACYFDHDETRIGALAEAAAGLGIERFILDDGWFRGRTDDSAGLGDWTADPVKYPEGLRPLADRIVALGMEFGLWVEPEMVNPDSELYRAHPEWALSLPGREPPTARHQLVLDLSQGEVRDYLFDALDALLAELPISYLKWDHNRDLAPTGGRAQVQGVYALLGRLRAAHPDVEIESCAGGGGRSDAGMVSFTHRFWASDNLDAVSRVSIQRGFLAFLPPEVMGAHVGASPAHATGRAQALAFRAAVAMPGHFGVELDPRSLGESERTELAEWIAFTKQWRALLHGGRVWLGEGADGLLWQAQGRKNEFLLFAIRTAPALDRRPQPLQLPFLAQAGNCEVSLLRIAGGDYGHAAADAPLFAAMREAPQKFTGSWLAHAGLPLPPLKAESVAIFHLKVVA